MSPSAHRRRERCCLCRGGPLELVLPLKPTPVADDFRRPEDRSPQELHPLELALCRACGHVQLTVAVDPDVLFREYTYVTAVSLGLVKHLQELARAACERAGAGPGDLAVDIGSNDGSLLRAFQERGLKVLGVDPAREIARRAAQSGVETLCAYFGSDLARRLRAERGAARVITAANVFAHSDALADMADGVREWLAPDGVFVFEVSYLADIVDEMLFDTVYHEHISYHTVAPLVPFFRARGLELVDVERSASKGGSIRVFVRPAGAGREASPAVRELLAQEERRGLARPEVYRAFAARIEGAKSKLLGLVDAARARGGRLAGYGASGTTTTLLHHFELGTRLDYLVDDNAVKQGLVSPGYRLPVLPSEALYEKRPAAVVILAWKYAEPILRRHVRYLSEGGRFLVPLPEPREVRR